MVSPNEARRKADARLLGVSVAERNFRRVAWQVVIDRRGPGIGRRRYPDLGSAPAGADRRHAASPGLGLFQLGSQGQQGAFLTEARGEMRAQR